MGRTSLVDQFEKPAQEYQDCEFSDELSLSDPIHPLFPASLCSNSATASIMWQGQNWQTGGRSRLVMHNTVHIL